MRLPYQAGMSRHCRVRGPVRLDERPTAIQYTYIKKVEKKKMFSYDKDKLGKTMSKTYLNVSPGTYDRVFP
jgi:hypothetical protein